MIHLRDNSGTATEDDINAAFQPRVTDAMFGPVTAGAQVLSLDFIKLDGTAATRTFPILTPTDWIGGSSGDPVPNQAAVVKFKTGIRGREARGRIFLGPVGEAAVFGGELTGSHQADLNAAWEAFRLASVGTIAELVVASYRHAIAHAVSSVQARGRVGSSVRRLNQIPLT